MTSNNVKQSFLSNNSNTQNTNPNIEVIEGEETEQELMLNKINSENLFADRKSECITENITPRKSGLDIVTQSQDPNRDNAYNDLLTLKAKINLDINTLDDFQSLEVYQKILIICPVIKLRHLLDVKVEVDKIVSATTNLQSANSRLYELLRIDLFNDIYENLFRIINKFYFKDIILNENFKDKLENILLCYWKLKNNFDEESLLALDITSSSPISIHSVLSRKTSLMSSISLDNQVLNRFNDGQGLNNGLTIETSNKINFNGKMKM